MMQRDENKRVEQIRKWETSTFFRIVPLATKSRNDREIWPKPFLQRNQKEDMSNFLSSYFKKSKSKVQFRVNISN